MTGILLLIIAIIIFIVADLIISALIRKTAEKRQCKQREEALAVNLNLDYTYESKTLKRVGVENPKARVLAVDDEEIILDSFRKILVLDGYSVDTVQTGREALGLIQKHHYDFCFTDFKMPEMNGIEVTKGVKYLRPDIDVIIITGYATIESAVDAMKFGAMEYIQKPFSEDELIDLVKKALIKRHDRIRKQNLPKVKIVHVYQSDYTENTQFVIPGGVFISQGHAWITIEQNGSVRVGIDDFATKFIGIIDRVELPHIGMKIKVGQSLFSVIQNTRSITFQAPVSGKVLNVNKKLAISPDDLTNNPYGKNWICVIETDNLDVNLHDLKIGESAIAFYYEEIQELHNILNDLLGKQLKLPSAYKSTSVALKDLNDSDWQKIADDLFRL